MNTHPYAKKLWVPKKMAVISLLVVASMSTHGATDLAPAPLITSPTASVLPNIFLMMDDSGSMAWDYMPDNAKNFGAGTYGAASAQCNGVFYDPKLTYTPPVDSTGGAYPNATFTAAWKDGYNTAGGVVDLSASFVDAGGDPAQAAFYYKYTGTQTTEKLKDYYNTASAFYKECSSNVGSAPGNGVFSKVVVGVTEQTNFANWYSYYRTRILMMKTATGLAFKTIGDNFRVGMATMNNNNGITGGSPDFLGLAPFASGAGGQKELWYAKLYATQANNKTPLREALSNVGRMYAMKLPSNKLNGVTVSDPIEYSCQQNFTILTTDGFWNGSTTYDLNGNAVGNQDGTEIRPMYDGANQSSQTVTTTDTVVRKQSVQPFSASTTWTQTVTSLGGACSIPGVVPSNTATAYMTNNNRNMAIGLSTTNPNTTNCVNLAADAWFCRSSSSSTNPVVSSSVVTDSNGTPWYLVSSVSGNSNCVTARSAWGSNYSSTKGVCPGTAAVNGTSVTTQQQTYTQTTTGSTTTVTDYPSTKTETVVTANGVVGAPVVSTTTGSSVVVSSTTAITSDTGAPSAGTTWTNSGGATTACKATPPAAGTSTATAGATSTTNTAAATVTTLSTSTTVNKPVNTVSASGGTFDTLADVAEYYYNTDLRTVALNNCTSALNTTICTTPDKTDPYNNVPPSGVDSATYQHMTTFTLGLGARGRMVFDPSYQTATTGDFYAVKQGSTATTGVCSWQTSGSCNWPTPASDAIENIDDLWHTAVNGRGTYFSAANPSDLSLGLTSALAGVSARRGSASAATTSTAFITQGDNFLFHSSFISQQWVGELTRQELVLATGLVNPTVDWKAQAKLDVQTNRNIYYFNNASTSTTNTNLSPFLWGNLNTTQKSYFGLTQIQTLTQSCALGATCLSVADQTLAAGSNLVNYIRGDRANEGALADNTKYYRQRQHLLGDIVNSESAYVKGALSTFADFGYSAFMSSTPIALRKAMVYVGANDGMLHAFNAGGAIVTAGDGSGEEAWAFIPSFVMPNLYKLADKGYDLKHQYYVDGTPVAGDICISGCTDAATAVWKTILVGGLNLGGRGYYALDITDPANPKALWEFTDVNMGYSYGNPKIAKLKNGTWVVLATSGYNNVAPDAPFGDGQGHLYVLDAATGTLINDIPTMVGTTAAPSGLARIDVVLAAPGVDATAAVAYGGDLQGNLWRFDINGADTQLTARWVDIGATGFDAQLLATLHDSLGNAQPITGKPLLTLVGSTLVVIVGTGRYLGSSDLADTSQQSLYAIQDTFPSGTTPSVAIWGDPRTQGTFVKQVQTTGTCPVGATPSTCSAGASVALSTNNAVNWSTNGGWYFDFAHVGERVNTDPDIAMGTVVLTTNIPGSSSCTVGGESYLYFINYINGGSVTTNGVVGRKLGNELASNPKIIHLPASSGGGIKGCVQGSAGGDANCTDIPTKKMTGTPRRVSWRELTP